MVPKMPNTATKMPGHINGAPSSRLGIFVPFLYTPTIQTF